MNISFISFYYIMNKVVSLRVVLSILTRLKFIYLI
jgi:hypothetical protein